MASLYFRTTYGGDPFPFFQVVSMGAQTGTGTSGGIGKYLVEIVQNLSRTARESFAQTMVMPAIGTSRVAQPIVLDVSNLINLIPLKSRYLETLMESASQNLRMRFDTSKLVLGII